MKALILGTLALTSSMLWARPNTVDFTCSQVREMVSDRGTFILSHGDDSLFSRFVSGDQHCQGGDHAVTAYALTQDEQKCRVGYVCKDRDYNGNFIAPSRIKVCREGSRQVFYRHDSSDDRTISEVRTCTNGRWYPKAPAPKITKCKDGRRFSGIEYLYERNGTYNVTRECKNGKYVIIRATPASER